MLSCLLLPNLHNPGSLSLESDIVQRSPSWGTISVPHVRRGPFSTVTQPSPNSPAAPRERSTAVLTQRAALQQGGLAMEHVLPESWLGEWTCFKFLHISYIPPSPASYPEFLGPHSIRTLDSPAFNCRHQHQCGVLFCSALNWRWWVLHLAQNSSP